ncbi:MAG TPA: trehalose-phosphatase [Actinomycetota bacterium]|nr:trehalose-phosphatase [Actinomycetota bacterium]
MEAEELVRAMTSRAERAGVFLDLDGTLAPIVPTPDLARVLPEVPEVLGRLAGKLAVVAIVSGRHSADIRSIVDVPGVAAVGTHGLEDEPPMAAEVLRATEEVAAALGAWVERKGAAVAVHFRGLDDPLAAAAAAEPALVDLAAAHGLELLGGKRILELMPAGRPRKGGAVERIVRERSLEAAMFAGDDVGDLDAFTALTRLRTEGVWTCAVIARGPETSDEVAAAADLAVDGPEGVVALLRQLAEALGP